MKQIKGAVKATFKLKKIDTSIESDADAIRFTPL